MGLLQRYPAFRVLWLGQLFSQLGNAVFALMGLWEIQLRSPVLLSVAGVASSVPAMLAVAGGILVDRYDARWLMLWTDVLRGAAVALGLVALLWPGALVADVIFVLAVNSLGSALFAPAEGVVIPELVADQDLPGANGMYNLTYQVATAVGSIIGGATIAALGVATIFGVDLASFWISALALWYMIGLTNTSFRHMTRPVIEPAETGPGGLRAFVRDGFRAVRELPGILDLLPLILLANFAYMAAFTMLPYWIHHVLNATVLWYGLISSGWAFGLMIGSVIAGRFSRWPLKPALILIYGTEAVLTGIFALVRQAPMAGAILLLSGTTNGVGNALTFTVFQRLIPGQIRGRAFGILMTQFQIATPLGAVAAGVLLHVLPLWWAWAFAAFTGFLLLIGFWRKLPDNLTAAGEGSAVSSGLSGS